MAKAKQPSIRVVDGKRIDLAELRRRRKLQRENAKPIEDTRVSETWARADARQRSIALDEVEAQAIASMPPNIDPQRDRVDNPNWRKENHGEKWSPKEIDVATNIKESGIVALKVKGAIEEHQHKAAEKFRRLFEAMGGKGARAIDYSREFVEGGRFPEPIGDKQIDAGKKLAAAYEYLVARHGIYGWKLVGYICGEGRSIHELTETRRQRDTMTDNLRSYLDCLAEHWDLSTGKTVAVPRRSMQALTSRA